MQEREGLGVKEDGGGGPVLVEGVRVLEQGGAVIDLAGIEEGTVEAGGRAAAEEIGALGVVLKTVAEAEDGEVMAGGEDVGGEVEGDVGGAEGEGAVLEGLAEPAAGEELAADGVPAPAVAA